MVIVMKPQARKEDITGVEKLLKSMGFDVHI